MTIKSTAVITLDVAVNDGGVTMATDSTSCFGGVTGYNAVANCGAAIDRATDTATFTIAKVA